MFVGDKGKILAGFNVENPRLIPRARMKRHPPPPPAPTRADGGPETPPLSPGLTQWVAACRGDKQHSPGSFLNAGPISEAVNLYAVALRTGRRLLYDAGEGDRHQRRGGQQVSLARVPPGLGPANHLNGR